MPVSIYISDFFFLESNHLPIVGPLQKTVPEQGRNVLRAEYVSKTLPKGTLILDTFCKKYVWYSETTQSCKQTPAGSGSQRASGATSALIRSLWAAPDGVSPATGRVAALPGLTPSLSTTRGRRCSRRSSEMGRQPAVQERGEQALSPQQHQKPPSITSELSLGKRDMIHKVLCS